MHIYIDGYNLIRQSADLKRFERQSLEAGRHALIAWLASYRQSKDHRITVVFDGWKEGSPVEERDVSRGITIIFSGRGVKADDVLKRIIATSDEELLVVSSDREIASFAQRHGRAAVSSPEFEALVNRAAADDGREEKDDEDRFQRVGKKGPARRPSRSRKLTLTKIRKL